MSSGDFSIGHILPLLLARQRHAVIVPIVFLLFGVHHLNEPLFA